MAPGSPPKHNENNTDGPLKFPSGRLCLVIHWGSILEPPVDAKISGYQNQWKKNRFKNHCQGSSYSIAALECVGIDQVLPNSDLQARSGVYPTPSLAGMALTVPLGLLLKTLTQLQLPGVLAANNFCMELQARGMLGQQVPDEANHKDS